MNDNVARLARIYVVMPGDSLASIAERFYGKERAAACLPELARVNGIAESAILTAGAKIKLPHPAAIKRNLELGALPTDLPVSRAGFAPYDSPPSATVLAPIDVTAPLPWYFKKEVWMAAAIGGLLAWLLLGKRRA